MYKILTVTSEKYHNFGTGGFNEFVLYRSEIILKELKEGNNIFQIDSDVVLYKPHGYFTNQMGDLDFIAQREHNDEYCCGFIVCKSNETMIKLWEQVIIEMKTHGNLHDEAAFNKVIKEGFKVNGGFFGDDVMSYGLITNGKVWEPNKDFDLPREISAFHANYTVGQENKEKLLDIVKRKYEHI